jgi:hypothetical protein
MRTPHVISVAAVVAFWLVLPVKADPDDVAWLGCKIAPVSKSLDAHLGLGGMGTMIINVAKASPADKAGLERYDIIVRLDDHKVASPEDLIQRIRKRKPDDRVTLHVLRRGKEKTIEIALAKRPEIADEQFKYEPLPDALLNDRIGVRGKILRRGPDGWIIEDLGDLDKVPHPLEQLLPESRRRTGRYWLKDDAEPIKKFQARVTQDGKVLVVEGEADGPITVRRIDADGSSTLERTYDTPEALKASDAEAYKVYVQATGRDRPDHRLSKRPGLKYRTIRPKRPHERYDNWLRDLFDDFPNLDELINEPRLRELTEHYEKKGKEAAERFKERLQNAETRLQELRKRIERRLESFGEEESELAEEEADAVTPSSDATTRFEVSPDGAITVHVRKGDSEATWTFKNDEELKTKRPDLFKKYESLTKQP